MGDDGKRAGAAEGEKGMSDTREIVRQLSEDRWPNLVSSFLDAMNDIGQYGFDKYREHSFQHKRLTGDRSRHMERIESVYLSLHAIEHFEMYLRGEIHDHFHTMKHQLAAVAFNAMMEFYFAGFDVGDAVESAERADLEWNSRKTAQSKVVSLEAELTTVKQALNRSLSTIAFFSSVIKSGERWSVTCQEHLEQMHEDRAALTRTAGGDDGKD